MKRVLFILSEYGYWGEELIGPLETLESEGIIVNFATPNGKKPHALPPSMDSESIDPPLGKAVVSEEMARKVQAMENSDKLNNPLNLKKLIQERPYLSSSTYLMYLSTQN